MSLKVLVIPEDSRRDEDLLLPLIRRMLAEIGKPRATIAVCSNPVLGGVAKALDRAQIEQIIASYPMVQVFLLIVDRDGRPGRRDSLDQIENRVNEKLAASRTLLGENAWQEIEVWALAGQDLPTDWRWQAIRDETDPKEVYFVPFVRQRGLLGEPRQGRDVLGREAADNYGRVQSRCEEIRQLQSRLKTFVGALRTWNS